MIASITVGLGVKQLLNPFSGKFIGSRTIFFTFLISLLANSSANATNLFCVRWKEYKKGIPVHTKEGEIVGVSKKAGESAVIQTALTRALMPVLPLLLPTLAFYNLSKFKLMPTNKIGKICIESSIMLVSLIYAPPLAIALFP